jgi:hypothetical protein
VQESIINIYELCIHTHEARMLKRTRVNTQDIKIHISFSTSIIVPDNANDFESLDSSVQNIFNPTVLTTGRVRKMFRIYRK